MLTKTTETKIYKSVLDPYSRGEWEITSWRFLGILVFRTRTQRTFYK